MAGLAMPQPDSAVLARRAEIVSALQAIVPGRELLPTTPACAPTRPTR